MSDIIIDIQHLSKSFSLLGEEHLLSLLFSNKPKVSTQIAPLRDINLQIKRGEVVGILGLNGSGKTTLSRIITGIYKEDAGHINRHGRIVAIFALRSGFNPLLSGRENIYLKAALFGMSKSSIDQHIDAIISFSELSHFIDKPLGVYSAGMKAKLGFAILTQVEADLFIIDEALSVGDKLFRAKCMDFLAKNKHKTSVIFITHFHEHLENFADRVLILHNGSIAFETTNYRESIDFYNQIKSKQVDE